MTPFQKIDKGNLHWKCVYIEGSNIFAKGTNDRCSSSMGKSLYPISLRTSNLRSQIFLLVHQSFEQTLQRSGFGTLEWNPSGKRMFENQPMNRFQVDQIHGPALQTAKRSIRSIRSSTDMALPSETATSKSLSGVKFPSAPDPISMAISTATSREKSFFNRCTKGVSISRPIL